ncbi:hypothetical protein AJ79_10336 [Helicocarpus griseus UAMH5409]|uniref:Uncharacterized protein n=1 Tax=Helicocarpus griseus UAMH5409 TaxID=1447875 RepID=A0A2B7WEF1_9EURO|nr:hypothetical protein AJ79_10336 [Helicocarpus griseus UAMH5409]
MAAEITEMAQLNAQLDAQLDVSVPPSSETSTDDEHQGTAESTPRGPRRASKPPASLEGFVIRDRDD